MTAIKPTIYLIKEKVVNKKDIFKKNYRLSSKEEGGATLFYLRSKQNVPDWAEFATSSFGLEQNPFKNASSYAVIVLEIENRLLAIPLGSGIHTIDMTKTEYNFGLKTALNCIPKQEIRQIDTTTPEINSQKTKKQASIGSSPEEFGIKKQKDILRGIVGKLHKGHELGEALEGKDSLRVSKGIESLTKLKSYCKLVLNKYQSDDYKKDYPWIDNMAMVRDRSLLEELSDVLAKSLKKGNFDGMLFSPPVFYENIFDYGGFIFSSGDSTRLRKKETFEMPEMKEWSKSIGNARKEINKENLEKYKVNLIHKGEGKNLDWPLERCIAWETDHKGSRYILSEGSWYAVAPDFFESVNNFYLAHLIDNDFPTPTKSKIDECDYNKEVADAKPDRYLFDLGHPDSKTKSIGKDENEVCDIYDAGSSTYIHVKKGKSSPTISHLFRQGAYSAEALRLDVASRTEFISHLVDYGCSSGIIPLPYSPGNYNVLFALLIGKRQKKDMPFFSKVSFKDLAENTIELTGSKCNITYVQTP